MGRTSLLVAFLLVLALGLATPSGGTADANAAKAKSEKANLWVDATGGSCARRGKRAYADASACASIDAAWDACRPDDTIVIKAGTYGPQTITGNKASPGCTVRGEAGTTIGALTTGGAFFTLRNVTVDVGASKRSGWRATADNVTLNNVRLHGPFVSAEISGVSNISWIGGELGTAGQVGGQRVCGQDAEPFQVSDADHVTVDGVKFHPQDADPTPNSCSANGFHLEMIRLDGGTTFFTLRNSTFDSGDHSGTSTVFITEPGGDTDPHDLTFENNLFGTNESIGAFNVHSNVATCRNFTFAYNTFLNEIGALQCTSFSNVKFIGNLGAKGPASSCFATFTNNVWQDPRRDSCGSDRWVTGTRGQVDRLGLGGPDGFHLQPGSPAINAGEVGGYCTAALDARDNGGQGRPKGTRCDAGGDEFDVPSRGPVSGSLRTTSWGRARTGTRVLTLTLDLDERVSAEVVLLRGNRPLLQRTFGGLTRGVRRATLVLGRGVPVGAARLRITLQDAARDQKVIQRRVRIPG